MSIIKFPVRKNAVAQQAPVKTEREAKIDAIIEKAFSSDPLEAIEEYKASLSEKQAVSFDNLMEGRWIFAEDGIDYFIPEIKAVVQIKPNITKHSTTYTVKAFSHNRKKSDLHYYYPNLEKAEKSIINWLRSTLNSHFNKVELREKEKNLAQRLQEFVKVGDILSSSWGYEQTNVGYYQVVGFRGKTTLELRKVGKITVKETSWCSCNVVPDIDNFVDDEVLKRKASVSEYNGNVGVSVKIDSCEYASLDERDENGDYRPKHCSWGY